MTPAVPARAALLLVLLGAAAPAHAQEALRRFEVTLQGGYRIGGEFEAEDDDESAHELAESDGQRITLNIQAAVDTQWEVLWGRQGTTLETAETFAGEPLLDIDVDYLHVGGTYLFEGRDVRPFVVATAGMTRFEPRGAGLDAENYLSASFGGGLQLRAGRRIGVRIEGRVFTSLIDSDGGLFCRSGPGAAFCAIQVDGDALHQWEAGVGLVYRF